MDATISVSHARAGDLVAGLSVFDLLLYASLYAFEVLVPRDFDVKAPAPPSGLDLQLAWDALGDLLAWKLAEASTSSLKLTDDSIGGRPRGIFDRSYSNPARRARAKPCGVCAPFTRSWTLRSS